MAETARDRFFTPATVRQHNAEDDLWVSFLGSVYDLTPLASKEAGNPLLKPIVAVAGTDISHWFNRKTGELRTHKDPISGTTTVYTPAGRFLHVAPPCPRTDWAPDFGTPWWRDEAYRLGRLTDNARKIRIVNTLTSQELTLEVCEEETLGEIQERYLRFNSHARSYTWKYQGTNLDMGETLAANGIKDDSPDMLALDLDRDEFLPILHVYFNDDLSDP